MAAEQLAEAGYKLALEVRKGALGSHIQSERVAGHGLRAVDWRAEEALSWVPRRRVQPCHSGRIVQQ